ncbi:hypothetical protein Lal_00047861 [Lupinus albus]|uniref:Uncharacterized protein n=1 Tax=Lupinus albus TaxID=3870 RepID=A0A6A5N4E6_LUPAL|nr:hypothetical protein Lalb_Chr02g0152781 [Lupinus albus]KAF1879188.1 hypothetical protein Lal_00047861 [Lupinus albus]
MSVVHISSDEEQGSEERATKTDFDWIKEFLDMSGDENSDDSDDVVIVGEKKPELKLKSLSTPAPKVLDDDSDDDDDCVVLDCDPEKGVTSVNEDSTGSDELLVVGEKGQIACRDYPHARHLCVKFPFSSTPHERNCDQCHCYVCDSLAPCPKWGTGLLSTDHCHANDKTESWKVQRRNLKLGIPPSLPASIDHDTPVHAVHSKSNEIRHRNIIRLYPNSIIRNQASRSPATLTSSSLNSIPQNQAPRPTTMCAFSPLLNSSLQNQVSRLNNTPLYSTVTNLTIPIDANHARCQESGSAIVRNRYQSHSTPWQMLGVRGHSIQKERGSGASRSSVRPQFLHSPMMSKAVNCAMVTPTVNHCARGSYGFSNHVNPAQQCSSYHSATGFSVDKNCNGLNNGVWLPQNSPPYPLPSAEPPNLSSVGQYTVAFDSQTCSEALPQSYNGHDFFQSCIQGSNAPSSYDVACPNSNQHGNEHQIRSQNENGSRNSSQCGILRQDTFQPKPQEECTSETATRDDFSAFDTCWTKNNSRSIDPFHLQTSASTNHCGSIEPLIEHSHLPNAFNDIENWLFGQDSVPMVTDGLLPELNISSPELGPIFDSGTPVTTSDERVQGVQNWLNFE